MAIFLKLALFISFIISCSSETSTSGTINWWCSQTPHQETCNYYLGRLHMSTTTTTISANQFLESLVKVAKDEGLVVLKQSQGIESKSPNAPGKRLWASCVDYVNETVFTLNMILDHHTHKPTPVDVQTWLSACLAYINSCKYGFELINLTTTLPTIYNNLTQLVINSLAINARNTNNTLGFADVDWDEYQWSESAIENPNVVVAEDGSGNFTSIQEAVNSAPGQTAEQRYVIYVKAGVYAENVVIPNTMTYITIYGDGINKTIITSNRNLLGGNDLKGTATFQVWGNGFMAQDITFQNTAGPEAGQAVAILSASDKSVFYRCSFEGYQDTLYTNANTQFYKECQIYGTVDFIFGDAAVIFQDCEIFFRKPTKSGLVVTAHGRGSEYENTAYSLQGCKVTAAEDLGPGRTAFLGRPWFPYAVMVYMQSFLDSVIDPQGWLDSYAGYNQTMYCGEYQNNGPGSSTDQRVKWRSYHALTNPKKAQKFTVARLLSGDEWLPATNVPYRSGLDEIDIIKSNV